MSKAVILALTFFSFAGLAAAQAGNVFFGYSFYNTNLSDIGRANTNGWEGTLEGKVLPWVGIIADFSGLYGSQDFPAVGSVNFNQYNVLFGPRVSASVGRLRPFGQAMLGVGHVNVNGGPTDTSFGTALGVGLDYRLVRGVAWRFQGDYLHTRFFGTRQDNARISTGIVLRF